MIKTVKRLEKIILDRSCKNGNLIRSVSNSTIEDGELKKFKKMVSSYSWHDSPEFAALRTMNWLRVPLIRDNLLKGQPLLSSKPLSDYSILDVGCGGGLLSEKLAVLGGQVTGIDPLEENIMLANDHKESSHPNLTNLQYKCSTIEDFSTVANSNSFDGIVASEVLEHVNDVDLFITCCHRLLKPNGSLFITTINQTIASYIFAIFVAENILKLLPQGTHDYRKLIPPNSLRLLLEESKNLLNFSYYLLSTMPRTLR